MTFRFWIKDLWAESKSIERMFTEFPIMLEQHQHYKPCSSFEAFLVYMSSRSLMPLWDLLVFLIGKSSCLHIIRRILHRFFKLLILRRILFQAGISNSKQAKHAKKEHILEGIQCSHRK